MKILFLIIVFFIIILLVNNKEKFINGMNYVAKHDYLKCKFNGGPGCENFRKQNTSPKILSGYLIDKNENIITLVKQYDPNKDKDIYFLRKKTNENNYYLDDIEFKQNRLYNNDILTV